METKKKRITYEERITNVLNFLFNNPYHYEQERGFQYSVDMLNSLILFVNSYHLNKKALQILSKYSNFFCTPETFARKFRKYREKQLYIRNGFNITEEQYLNKLKVFTITRIEK